MTAVIKAMLHSKLRGVAGTKREAGVAVDGNAYGMFFAIPGYAGLRSISFNYVKPFR